MEGACIDCVIPKFFNDRTKQCESCQKNEFYDVAVKGCSVCPEDKPIGKGTSCIPCPETKVYDSSSQACVCPEDKPIIKNGLCIGCP